MEVIVLPQGSYDKPKVLSRQPQGQDVTSWYKDAYYKSEQAAEAYKDDLRSQGVTSEGRLILEGKKYQNQMMREMTDNYKTSFGDNTRHSEINSSEADDNGWHREPVEDGSVSDGIDDDWHREPVEESSVSDGMDDDWHREPVEESSVSDDIDDDWHRDEYSDSSDNVSDGDDEITDQEGTVHLEIEVDSEVAAEGDFDINDENAEVSTTAPIDAEVTTREVDVIEDPTLEEGEVEEVYVKEDKDEGVIQTEDEIIYEVADEQVVRRVGTGEVSEEIEEQEDIEEDIQDDIQDEILTNENIREDAEYVEALEEQSEYDDTSIIENDTDTEDIEVLEDDITSGEIEIFDDEITETDNINEIVRKRLEDCGVREVELDGVLDEYQEVIVRDVEEMCDRYPELKGYISKISTAKLDRGVFACAGPKMGNNGYSTQIQISEDIYSHEGLEISVDNLETTNWKGESWLAGHGQDAILKHEMGHILHLRMLAEERGIKLGDYNYESYRDLCNAYDKNDIVTDICRDSMAELDINQRDLARELSVYGSSNWGECFAEAISEVETSDNPRELSRRIYEKYQEVKERC